MSKRKLEATRANQARKAGQGGRRTPPGYRAPSRRGGFFGRWRWVIVGGVALVALVVIGVAAASQLGGYDSSSYKKLLADGTCKQGDYPEYGHSHLTDPRKTVKYKQDPATSGPHYQYPADYGIYRQPIRQEILVHNLEHGQVVVEYGNKVSAADVGKVTQDITNDRDLMLLAPYPKLSNRVVITAWRHSISCTGYQPAALSFAKHTWRDHGREKFAVDYGRRANW